MKALQEQVQQHGLYHAYRLAIAPTQSISYVQNATSSVMPIVDQIERRTYGNAETFYPMPFLSPETMWYYKSAFNTDQNEINRFNRYDSNTRGPRYFNNFICEF